MHLKVTNPGAFPIDVGVLGLPDNVVVPSNLDAAREYPKAKFTTVHSTGNVNTANLTVDFSFSKIMIRKNQPFPLDYLLKYRNPTQASCVYPIYYFVCAASSDGNLAPSATTMQIEYKLLLEGYFTDRIDSIPSMWKAAMNIDDEASDEEPTSTS